MGILSKLLGTGDIIKEGFALIDSVHTSEAESIEAKAKAKVDVMNAYAPFKVAQRLLALMFTTVFLGCFILGLSYLLYATATGSATAKESVEAIKFLMDEFYIAQIEGAIVGFYFGGGMAEGIINARGKK